jgi:hypothetical protein
VMMVITCLGFKSQAFVVDKVTPCMPMPHLLGKIINVLSSAMEATFLANSTLCFY